MLMGLGSAGFYAENLLLYSEQARTEGVLPLPIGESHKFAPVALGVSFLSQRSWDHFADEDGRISPMWLHISFPARAPTALTTSIAAR